MKKTTLRDELISSGASQKEAETLTKLATYIRTKPEVIPGLSDESKARIFNKVMDERDVPSFGFISKLATAGAMAGFIGLAMLAQSSLPGSKLYALKRGSEKAIVFMDPDFKKNVEKRRESELSQLKKKGASDDLIRKAESSLSNIKHELDDKKKSDDSASGSNSTSTTVDDSTDGSNSNSNSIGGEDSAGGSNSSPSTGDDSTSGSNSNSTSTTVDDSTDGSNSKKTNN